MAVGQAALTDQISAVYNENLLPPFAKFNELYTWNITDGTSAVIENSVLRRAYGLRSMLTTFTGTDETVFNASGSELLTVAPYDGVYTIGMAFWIDSDSSASETAFTIIADVNGIATDLTTFQADIKGSEGFVFDKWNVYLQKIELAKDDEVNFTFKANCDTIGVKLFADLFTLSVDDKKEGLITRYIAPYEKSVIWQSRVDTTNTQNISADTETNFGFIGTSESNDSTTLLTTTGLITPTKVNNVITVNYYFDFDAPSGADRFVDVLIKVNSIVYRGETSTLSKTAGQTERVSGSFTLPVGADFKTYGAQITITSSEAIVIENRYICVIEQTNIE